MNSCQFLKIRTSSDLCVNSLCLVKIRRFSENWVGCSSLTHCLISFVLFLVNSYAVLPTTVNLCSVFTSRSSVVDYDMIYVSTLHVALRSG